jgi:hypothetical protein
MDSRVIDIQERGDLTIKSPDDKLGGPAAAGREEPLAAPAAVRLA